jgi:DNA-binding CsgD family transcriptional regulator
MPGQYFMIRGNAIAVISDMPAERNVKLSEQEQALLIRAIESAIEVGRQDQFDAWMRGPFRALVPHESVVCMELDERGTARQVACLHHNLVDATTMEFLGNPERGLAVRLARSYRSNRRQSCKVDANALKALLDTDGSLSDRGCLNNAVIHRIKLLSGTTYCIVLVNVAEDQLDRCRQLFKLLSSHLKMALSLAIAQSQRKEGAPLTRRELEIVQLMSKGKSNREISVILGISAITLKSHVAKLYRKLDVQNRADAVSRGLTSPDLSTRSNV